MFINTSKLREFKSNGIKVSPLIILLIWLLKSDFIPVRGDSYKPSLQSSDSKPTQKHRTTCGQDLVVVMGVKGSSKFFSDSEILKATTVSPL